MRPDTRLTSPSAGRRGFSLMELLIVVVITGVITMMSVPRLKTTLERRGVEGARQRVEAMIATARASAIQKGRQSLFMATGSGVSVWTMNPTTGYWEAQVPYQLLTQTFPGVSLQIGGSGWWYVWYDSRGLTYSKPPSTTVFRIVGASSRDSVCVSRFGQVLPRRCAL